MMNKIKLWLRSWNAAPHLKKVATTDGWLSFDEADLLYRLARDTNSGCIVEVGSYRGRATVALALGAMRGYSAPVFTLDPHETFAGSLGGKFGPEDRGCFYRTMLRTSCYRSVRLINLSSDIVAPGWQQEIGLLWLDGDHAYKSVKRDLECWLPFLVDGAHVVFDDTIDPELGPYRVISEVLDRGGFERIDVVGKVTVLRKLNI